MDMLTEEERNNEVDKNIKMLNDIFIKSLNIDKSGEIHNNIREKIEEMYDDVLITIQTLDERYKDQLMAHMFTTVISNMLFINLNIKPGRDDEKH